MEDGWILVYQADEEYKAEVIRQLLEHNGLHPVLMDHKDDEFRIGSVELFVSALEAEKANAIIENNRSED
ncbi:MAG: DUF2007 domain-containing protein [Saprospiraceae bacterium]|nr:DUF2007 domain-containing protein [Saprospiraceae bacterium]